MHAFNAWTMGEGGTVRGYRDSLVTVSGSPAGLNPVEDASVLTTFRVPDTSSGTNSHVGFRENVAFVENAGFRGKLERPVRRAN